MKYLSLLLSLIITSALTAEEATSRPNIVIIFTDDQGYADLACYGNQNNKTPRLDQLAKEGTRYTSFYTQTVCGPSRSALLTGRYPSISRGWGMPANETTWASLIRGTGYQTVCIGKWDVSNRKAIINRMPNAQGFDYYFGALGANDNGKVTFHENNEPAGSTDDMGGLTTLYTNKSIEWLEKSRDPEKPFALYLAHTMMHTIVDASDQFRGKSAGGLYGDVVEEFDYETGRLLDKLDELKLSDNTLVIYTSDNGPWNQEKYTTKKKGHPEGSIFWGESGPLRNGKGSCYEGGYRAACIVRWPGRISKNTVSDSMWATIDFLPTFANLAGFEVPDDRIIHGIDQTNLLVGKTQKGRETFYYNNAGIRKGKWKYLLPNAHFHGYAVETDRKKVDELYDLDTDISETKNLASQYPDLVDELKSEVEKYQAERRALPEPTTSVEKLSGLINLKKGDTFSFEQSPEVVGKTITIKTKIKPQKGDGVIVAQGGTLVGYSLFLREGKVILAVRDKGKLTELIGQKIEIGSEAQITAIITKTGVRTLTVEGTTANDQGSAITQQPKMGLSAGEDQSNNVATYTEEKFSGKIRELILKVN